MCNGDLLLHYYDLLEETQGQRPDIHQHSQLPGCTGCLLSGGLTLTTTGLAPASRRQLSGHTNDLLESPGKQGRGHLASCRPLGLLAWDLIQYRNGTSLFVLSMYAR